MSEGEKMRERYGDAAIDEAPFGGLAASSAALGDLQVALRKLAEVAPEQIRVEMEFVSDKVESASDISSGDLLGALFGSALDAATIAGPLTTVDEFAQEICHSPVFGDANSPPSDSFDQLVGEWEDDGGDRFTAVGCAISDGSGGPPPSCPPPESHFLSWHQLTEIAVGGTATFTNVVYTPDRIEISCSGQIKIDGTTISIGDISCDDGLPAKPLNPGNFTLSGGCLTIVAGSDFDDLKRPGAFCS